MSPSESSSPASSMDLMEHVPPATNVLSGPLGLRAGWGLLLFAVLAIALGITLFFALLLGTGQMKHFQQARRQTQIATDAAIKAHQPPPTPPVGPLLVSLTEMSQAGAVVLAAFAIHYVEKRRFGVYGLPGRHLRNLLPGAVSGLLAISLLIGLLVATHALAFDGRLLHGPAVVRYGLAWLAFFLLVGIFEEFLFRGYVQFTLMRGLLGLGERLSPRHARAIAFWIGAAVWSLLFLLTHMMNAGEDPLGLVSVFEAGMLFSFALWRTGSLWWGVGFHMTWDWGQSFLYGVPDSGNLSAGRLFATHAVGNPLLSGGPAGPEGSLLVVPVIALAALVIAMHPQAEQPAVEPASFPLAPRDEAAGRLS